MDYINTSDLIKHLASAIGYHRKCGSPAHKTAQLRFRGAMHYINSDSNKARDYAEKGLRLLQSDNDAVKNQDSSDIIAALGLADNQEATA